MTASNSEIASAIASALATPSTTAAATPSTRPAAAAGGAPIVAQEQNDAAQTYTRRWRNRYLDLWQKTRIVEWRLRSITNADGVVTELWDWTYIDQATGDRA